MAKQIINTGRADKGDGDKLRDAFTKVNENFNELYNAVGADVQIPNQAGNANKYLKTNGTVLSWATVSDSGSTNELVNGTHTVSLSSVGLTAFPAISNESLFIQASELGSANASIGISAKNSVIVTANILDTAKQWTFGTDGALTVPGTLDYKIGESFGGGSLAITSEGAVNIFTNSVEGFKLWQFDAAGSLQLPVGGDIRFGYGYIDQDTDVQGNALRIAGGNSVVINTDEDGKTWTFGNDGALTLPDAGIVKVGADTAQVGSTTTIVTGSAYGDTAVSIAADLTLVSIYPAGSTITFQDGEVRTITAYDDYPGGTDIFWDTPKTGTLFPIILKTANYVAATTSAEWTFGTDGRTTFPNGVVPEHSYGAAGDKEGMVVFSDPYIYYCKQDYVDNVTDIWVRVAWTGTNW